MAMLILLHMFLEKAAFHDQRLNRIGYETITHYSRNYRRLFQYHGLRLAVTHLSKLCQIVCVNLPNHLTKVVPWYSPCRCLIEQTIKMKRSPFEGRKLKGLQLCWNTFQMEYQVLYIALVNSSNTLTPHQRLDKELELHCEEPVMSTDTE